PTTPEKPQADKPQGTETPNKPATSAPAKPKTSDNEDDFLSDAGILNSRAVDLPKPVYPAAARKDHVQGQVQVKVVLDETGKVVSAEAMFGPDALRAAAVEAAKRARFNPIVIGGTPQKVFGILLYDFVAP
ncbi:MAG TPA: TonB family protein, partial [Pyrinomonadaceae bacterium]|nr:TonB family protein [Pyrinomonadaceae bacterium]